MINGQGDRIQAAILNLKFETSKRLILLAFLNASNLTLYAT
jgi:hypothetical protein